MATNNFDLTKFMNDMYHANHYIHEQIMKLVYEDVLRDIKLLFENECNSCGRWKIRKSLKLTDLCVNCYNMEIRRDKNRLGKHQYEINTFPKESFRLYEDVLRDIKRIKLLFENGCEWCGKRNIMKSLNFIDLCVDCYDMNIRRGKRCCRKHQYGINTSLNKRFRLEDHLNRESEEDSDSYSDSDSE